MPVGIPRRPLTALRGTVGNPRLHAPAQLEALAASIRTFGFLAPLVVDADGAVLAGHARLAAATALGLREVPVVVEQWLTPAQRRAYLIADNQLTVASAWDEPALAAWLVELQAANAELLGTLGFAPEALAALLASAERTAAAEREATFPAYDGTITTAYQCPSCGFEWSGSPKPKHPTAAPE